MRAISLEDDELATSEAPYGKTTVQPLKFCHKAERRGKAVLPLFLGGAEKNCHATKKDFFFGLILIGDIE